MANADNTQPLKLDPISARIIRQHLLQSFERISNENMLSEEDAGEEERETTGEEAPTPVSKSAQL